MHDFSRYLRTLGVLFLLLVGAGRAHAQISFGNVEVGRTQVRVLSLGNGCAFASAALITYEITGPAAGDYQVSGPNSVPAAGGFQVTISFTPSQLGTRAAQLKVSLTPDPPIAAAPCFGLIDLTGNGVSPRIVCRANITKDNDPNQCGAVVVFPAPIPVGAAGAITCTPDSGSFFPVGTTTVNCTSASGATCSFTVTVRDTQPPTITCPANITVPTDPGQCTAAVTFPSPTASDNCTASPSVVCKIGNQVITSPHTFPVGTTTVTCTATDAAARSASCSFTVTVNDTLAPTITCPADITVSNDPGKCGAVVTFSVPFSDNCPGFIEDCDHLSGDFYPVGTTTVTCRAIDADGNVTTCSFKITVKDTEKPIITCPPSIILPQDPGMRGAIFHPSPAEAHDDCPGVVVSGQRSDGIPLSDPIYPVGATCITWTATDASGNQASCKQIVNVHDSRIVGVVGQDTNGNHLPDPPQEPRLKGVTIELHDPVADEFWAAHPETKQPEPLATTRTNEVGNFSFPVAPPGVYDVVVKLAEGQTISALFPGPSNQAQIVTVNGEPRLRVTMQAGDTVAGLGILLQ